MVKERQIEPVKDHEQKKSNYKEHVEKYKKAVSNGFFLEAILIDYACLEDRLRYMLYYLGLIRSEKDYKVTDSRSRRVQVFRRILYRYGNDRARMSIQTITGKREIAASIFKSVLDQSDEEKDQVYLFLKEKINDPVRLQHNLDLLKQIEEWCKYRNEIIHSLMNKNLDSLHESITEKTIEGFNLFRDLDLQVQWIKRKRIRSKIGLKE